jgi:hypothetical protein
MMIFSFMLFTPMSGELEVGLEFMLGARRRVEVNLDDIFLKELFLFKYLRMRRSFNVWLMGCKHYTLCYTQSAADRNL